MCSAHTLICHVEVIFTETNASSRIQNTISCSFGSRITRVVGIIKYVTFSRYYQLALKAEIYEKLSKSNKIFRHFLLNKIEILLLSK